MEKMGSFEREIVKGILDYIGNEDYSEVKELIELIMNETNIDDDFYVEFDGHEFRFIHKEVVDEVWEKELQETIEDCYDLNSLPHFVEIDWEATVNNCKVDGLGHHFNTWDGSEEETENFMMFRV